MASDVARRRSLWRYVQMVALAFSLVANAWALVVGRFPSASSTSSIYGLHVLAVILALAGLVILERGREHATLTGEDHA